MTMQRKARRSRGFTLIELLVSLTVLAAVLALALSGFRIMTRDWDIDAERIQNIDMVSRAADIFKRDMANLQRVVSSNEEKNTFVFAGAQTGVEFVALEPPFPTGPGLYFIRYRVASNGERVELIRERAQFRKGMVYFPGTTPANRVPVLQGRFQLKLSYGYKEAGRETWLLQWSHSNRLPQFIRLDILDLKSAAPLLPPIIVRVRSDAEVSCLSAKDAVCSANSEGVLERVAKRGGDRSSAQKSPNFRRSNYRDQN